MVIVKLVFMTTNSLIHNFGQCARIGVRFGPLFSSGSSVLLWQQRSENQDQEDIRTVETNLEGVSVQQWPEFKTKKKVQSKKVKSLTA